MSKLNRLTPILFLILTLPFCFKANASNKAQKPNSDCIKIRMAIDIGSGSTRVRSAVIDTCTQLLIATIAKTQTPIAFKDHLTAQTSEPKSFSSDFMKQSTREIKEAVAKVETETQHKLKTEVSLKPYKKLATALIEKSGVATEGFRQASNNADLIANLAKEKIKIHLITQTDEGHLGFIGAQSALGTANGKASDPNKIISWDIGGGSLQIVGHSSTSALQNENTKIEKNKSDQKKNEPLRPEESSWLDYGNKLASIPTRIFVLENFKKQPALSKDKKPNTPNPILPANVVDKDRLEAQLKLEAAVNDFAEKQLQDFQKLSWWKTPGLRFYGIGGVHNGIMSSLKILKGYDKAPGYSLADLDLLLSQTLSADDEKLAKDYGVPPAYTSGAVTNILLVKAVMKILNIDTLEVLDVDNTQAVLIAPQYWN